MIESMPLPLLVALATGGGWCLRHLLLVATGRRKENALARKADAETEVTVSGAWQQLANQLRAEMKQRDEACDRRMAVMEKSLRADFAKETLKLRSVIYSLSKNIPLDAKQAALVNSIAPKASQ